MSGFPFEILYEDDNMIAIAKPSGMLTLPDRHDTELRSVRSVLEEYYGKIFVVHRLDKDTSGVIILAKNETAHAYFSKLFEGRSIEKLYLGLVSGRPLESAGSIDEPIAESTTKAGVMLVNKRGKASLTDYKIIKYFNLYSLVEFRIHTGRTHQIRVHCKHIGHPIICDSIYGDGKAVFLSAIKKKYKLSKHEEAEKPLLGRLALHAWKLRFKNMNGISLILEAPLPKDMHVTIRQLEKYNKN